MLTADRNGVAKAERIAFEDTIIALLALGLIHGKNDGGCAAAQPARYFFIERCDTYSSVDQKKRNLGASYRSFGLHPHATGQCVRIFILITSRVDNGEFKVEKSALTFPPVARDTGCVIDKRKLFADQAVEQCRLADIRPTDNGYRRQHAGTTPSSYPRKAEIRPESSRM